MRWPDPDTERDGQRDDGVHGYGCNPVDRLLAEFNGRTVQALKKTIVHALVADEAGAGHLLAPKGA